MSSSSWLFPVRGLAFVAAAALCGAGASQAQLASVPGTPAPSAAIASNDSSLNSTSSSSSLALLTDSNDAAEPANPSPKGGGQYDNTGGGGGGMHGLASKLSFEAGGGFNAPIGNDLPYITWGGNFTLGAGLHLSRRFAVLAEYQFIDDKLPGAFVAAGGGETGNAHINSITVSPVIDLFPKKNNSVYLVGGGGWYHKSTNFNIQECCDFYGYPVTVTANSFTSNQAGANIGLGYSHRLGGMYNDGTMKLFAEARYLFINTPGIGTTNGLGTTELIPVTVGVRF